MKKLISIMIISVMVLSVLALTACGGGGSSEDLSDSKYVGTWKAAAVAIGDDSEEMTGEYFLVVNGDGTGTLTGDEGEESSFTWQLIDGGFKTKGDVKMTLKDDGDNIKTSLFGIDLIFERQ